MYWHVLSVAMQLHGKLWIFIDFHLGVHDIHLSTFLKLTGAELVYHLQYLRAKLTDFWHCRAKPVTSRETWHEQSSNHAVRCVRWRSSLSSLRMLRCSVCEAALAVTQFIIVIWILTNRRITIAWAWLPVHYVYVYFSGHYDHRTTYFRNSLIIWRLSSSSEGHGHISGLINFLHANREPEKAVCWDTRLFAITPHVFCRH